MTSADVDESQAAPTEARERPKLTVDPDTLEEVMKRALEEVSVAKPGRKRQQPDKTSLERALRNALDDYDVETRQLAAPGTARRQVVPVDLDLPRPVRRPRRRLSMASAFFIVVLLLAGAGLWYAMQLRAGDGVVVASGPSTPSKPHLPKDDRAALVQTMTVLRDLQGMSRPDVPFRVYFNRVSFAKADVERYMYAVNDLELRASVQEIVALHQLAASAWRAKTLNERDKWEAVGDDPTVELCTPARRLLSVGDEAQTMSRAQWRGIALAAAIPVLWDCTAERIAEADKHLRDR